MGLITEFLAAKKLGVAKVLPAMERKQAQSGRPSAAPADNQTGAHEQLGSLEAQCAATVDSSCNPEEACKQKLRHREGDRAPDAAANTDGSKVGVALQ